MYNSLKECKDYIKTHPGAKYKGFKTKKEAQEYITSFIKKNKK